MRTVIWFSCGAASTVAAFTTLLTKPNAILVYCDTGGEHPDNLRFLKDVENWLNKKVTILRSDKYQNHFDVIRKTKYVNGPNGARCTAELKKKLRFSFQEPDDIQVFGYTADEQNRADRFVRTFPEANAKFPLIEEGLTKGDCFRFIKDHGIELPEMYRLGFNNNNCIGCVKGGAGYWNHIRKVFPDKFKQMAELEREVGHSCIKGKFLDELKTTKGRHKQPDMSCDFLCQRG